MSGLLRTEVILESEINLFFIFVFLQYIVTKSKVVELSNLITCQLISKWSKFTCPKKKKTYMYLLEN